MRKHIKLCFIVFAVCLLAACSKSGPQLKPLSNNDVILAFGDSLTVGVGTTKENSYPVILEQLTGLKVVSSGISGEDTTAGLKRLPSVLEKVHPALVILCEGGNDLIRKQKTETTIQNLIKMIEIIKAHNAQVILVAVPAIKLYMKPAPFFEQVSEATDVPLIDMLLPTLYKDKSLKSDTVHLNAAGYKKMAEGIYLFLKDNNALS